jgi:hypothetical protein
MKGVTSADGWIVLLLASVVSVSLAPSLSAHEQKKALTDIFYNERSGNLEIAHRFSLHDAEHTLHKATDSKADLASSSEAQVAFAKYVAARFALIFKDKTSLKLALVGQEMERGYLWVYQETRIPDPVDTAFFIENTILQDVVKAQVNTVNVRYRKEVATFEFDADAGRQLYSRPVDTEQASDDGGEE